MIQLTKGGLRKFYIVPQVKSSLSFPFLELPGYACVEIFDFLKYPQKRSMRKLPVPYYILAPTALKMYPGRTPVKLTWYGGVRRVITFCPSLLQTAMNVLACCSYDQRTRASLGARLRPSTSYSQKRLTQTAHENDETRRKSLYLYKSFFPQTVWPHRRGSYCRC
jgi:hypothetical protein